MLAAWAEAPLGALLDSVPDALLGVDERGTILAANVHALRLFGYTSDELVGSSVDRLVPDHARAAHPAHRARFALDPAPRPMGALVELAARCKDGREFPAEISLSAVETHRGTIFSAAIRDVTARVAARAERERLRAAAVRAEREQAQSHRLASLGLLAGGVAHDFNNLLAAILNYSACVRRDLESMGEAGDLHRVRALDDLDQVRRAAERGADLTAQLLSFARLDESPPAVIDPAAVVTELLPLLRRTLPPGIALVADLAGSSWHVSTDVGPLERVLVNLVVNARDALGASGTIEVRTTDVALLDDPATDGVVPTPPLPRGRYVRIAVTDDGAGMAPEVAAHVFDPFFTTKPRGEGTGLGLATVHGIVGRAGGHVRIESQVGRGTTCQVWFPAAGDDGGPDGSS